LRLRLLDSEQQLRLGEDILGGGQDRRPLRLVFGVADRASLAGTPLDQYLMAVFGQLPGTERREGDAVLIVLDLGGYADLREPDLWSRNI
jgi:hypothetical protein